MNWLTKPTTPFAGFANTTTRRRTTGNMEHAADELMHAYMGLNDEAWLDKDPKYLDFLATVAQGIESQ